MSVKSYRTAGILLAALALIVGIYVGAREHKHVVPQDMRGTWLTTPRVLQPFQMQYTEGGQFTNDTLKGHWSLVFFGFTHCPELCPTTMSELAKAIGLLKSEGLEELPQVTMVTVDPEHDGLEALKTYVKGFNSKFTGAVPDAKMLKRVAREVGVAYQKVSGDSDNIEHTGAILLFNPQGELAGFFTYPHVAGDMVHDLKIALG